MDLPSNVRSSAARLGIQLTDSEWAALQGYVDLLIEANKDINLISRKDEGNIWSGHILHSLALLTVLQLPGGIRLMDLGTGGGLPGIPLAIARPDITVTVIDSIQKKTRTVQNILTQLALPNVEVVTGRAEELKPKKGSGYHVVVARAVAPLVDLLKWSANLFERRDRKVVRAILPGSIQEVQTPLLAAMKGGELDDEIRRAAVHFPGLVSYVARFPCTTEDVPLLDDKRVIIVPR